MDRNSRSRLELALVTPDGIHSWNTVVKAHGLYFKLSYDTHHPTLFVGTKDGIYLPWFIIDTRKQHIEEREHIDPQVNLGIRNLKERLAGDGLKVAVRYDVKQQQKFVSLRFVSLTGGPMTIILDRIKKGQVREYHEFALNDRW